MSNLPPNPYADRDIPPGAATGRKSAFCYRCDKWVKDADAHARMHADDDHIDAEERDAFDADRDTASDLAREQGAP